MYPNLNNNAPHKKTWREWREHHHLTWHDAPLLVTLKAAEVGVCYAVRPCRAFHGKMKKKIVDKYCASGAKTAPAAGAAVSRRSLLDSDEALIVE